MNCIHLFGIILVCVTSVASARVFDVTEFGAVPDSGEDAGPAIRRAIASAIAQGEPATVRFPAGVFHIAPDEDADTALPIRDADGLCLVGAGSATRLVITDPRVDAVRFHNSSNVRIAHVTIDYDPLPFTQGDVVDVAEDGSFFTFAVDSGYLPPTAQAFVEAAAPWGMVVRQVDAGGEQFGPVPLMDGVWSHDDNGLWRCTFDDRDAIAKAHVIPGARYMYKARTMASSGVAFWSCVDVRLESVVVHAAPSLALLFGLCENVTIDGLRVERPENTQRLLSSNADGIHCLGNRGALRIENCYFEAMADDAINIHARAAVIMAQPGPHQLLVNEGGTVEHRQGDRLQLYDPEAGRIRTESLVVTAVQRDHQGTLLTLKEPVQDVVTGNTFQESDHLFNLDACGAGAVIRNNTFGSHRGRAILLKTTDTIVEENTFRNREGWGITLHQLQGWGEGPAGQRIRIRKNTFEGAGIGFSASIDICPRNRRNEPAAGRPVRDIYIENNTFRNPPNGIVTAWAVENLTLADNVVLADPGARVVKNGPLVALHTGAGFRIRGLQVTDHAEQTTAVIEVSANVPPGAAGVQMEDIHVTDNTLPILRDHRPE